MADINVSSKRRIPIGIIFRNAVEFIKSKTDSKYILSDTSPDFFKRNKELILRTIKANPVYLNSIPEDMLIEELEHQVFPENGLILTAFRRGYRINPNNSPRFMFGKKGIKEFVDEEQLKKLEQKANSKDRTYNWGQARQILTRQNIIDDIHVDGEER